jgi:hypothetical protein
MIHTNVINPKPVLGHDIFKDIEKPIITLHFQLIFELRKTMDYLNGRHGSSKVNARPAADSHSPPTATTPRTVRSSPRACSVRCEF